MAQSGIDSLLDALKQSGVNVDDIGGGSSAKASQEAATDASAEGS